MIGNAVPVNLAKFVASAINKYIASPHTNRNLEIDFENWEIEDRLAWCASEPLPYKQSFEIDSLDCDTR